MATNCQENNGPGLMAFFWAMLSIATLVVALRLYFKRRRINCIGWDDYLIVLSLVSGLCQPIESNGELTRGIIDVRLR